MSGTYISTGRMPMPWGLRWSLIGGVIVVSVVGIWFLFTSTSPPATQPQQHVLWSPGGVVNLPPATKDTASADTGNKSTGNTGSAPPPQNATLAPVMSVWGAKDVPAPPSTSIASKAAGALSGGKSDGDADDDSVHIRSVADRSMLLGEGEEFHCIIDRIVKITGNKSEVTCYVSEKRGVWSDDGTNLLIDKGAKAIGTVEHGLENGDERGAIVWKRVTSNRVFADLKGSASEDVLGQYGVPGEVDNQWGKRLKGAVMLTALDTAANVAQNYTSRGNTANVNISSGQTMAQTALQHDYGNIPSILNVKYGQEIMIRVNHDIPFKKAYNDTLIAGVR